MTVDTAATPEEMPSLTTASTADETSSLEEFPMHTARTQSVALATISPSTDELGLKPAKAARAKRFSLQALKRPLIRATRGSSSAALREGDAVDDKANISTGLDSSNDERVGRPSLQSAMVKNGRSPSEGRREARRVSFSPSTEDSETAARALAQSHEQHDDAPKKGKSFVKRTGLTGGKGLKLKRRASFDESIGRTQGKAFQAHPLRRSLSISGSGIHLDVKMLSKTGTTVNDKGQIVTPRVARQQAIAARHARVLEQIINAGTSIELEEIKAKRIRKIGVQKANEHRKVQQYPVVAPRKIKALKQALLDHELASGIIGELRCMQVDPGAILPCATDASKPASGGAKASEAQAALQNLVEKGMESAGEEEKEHKRKQRPRPLRAVCLDCTEEEAVRRTQAGQQPARPDAGAQSTGSSEGIDTVAAIAGVSMMGLALGKLGNWFSTPAKGTQQAGEAKGAVEETIQYAYELKEDIRQGDMSEALADSARLGTASLSIAQPTAGVIAEQIGTRVLPENRLPNVDGTTQSHVAVVATQDDPSIVTSVAGALSGVSPISLLTSPTMTLTTLGAQQSGAFDALADISGAAISSAQGGKEAMQDVCPPLDRMAIFIHWWGFELTLPEASMRYLSTAHSVSGAFMGFLQTMVTSGGVPELLPFVRYISSFMDMEFSAIKSQDRDRRGVVIAATWLMPLALVPRPWDYGYNDGSDTGQPTKDPPSSSAPPSSGYRSPPVFPNRPPSEALPQLPPGGLPILPIRISSSSSVPSLRDQARNVSPSSKHLSSQERHFAHGQGTAIAAALNEPPKAKMRALESASTSGSMLNVLDSLEEVPEGSMRIK